MIIFLGRWGSGYSSPKHSTTWYLGKCRPLWAKSWSSERRRGVGKKTSFITDKNSRATHHTHTHTHAYNYLFSLVVAFFWKTLWQVSEVSVQNSTKNSFVMLCGGPQKVGGDSTHCPQYSTSTPGGTYPGQATTVFPLTLSSTLWEAIVVIITVAFYLLKLKSKQWMYLHHMIMQVVKESIWSCSLYCYILRWHILFTLLCLLAKLFKFSLAKQFTNLQK